MRKKLLLLLIGFTAIWAARVSAADLPTPSTPDNVVWYMVQFMNGENVLTAQGDGEQVLTGIPTGKDAQLWKVEGTAVAGYTLTSKTGLTLYSNTTALNGKFYASSAPSGNTLFSFVETTNTAYAGGLLIAPKPNQNVFMNQFGGAGVGVELGLWNNKNDANQPLQFVSATDIEELLPLIPYPASLVRHEGTLSLNQLKSIACADDDGKALAEEFSAQLEKVAGIRLVVESGGNVAKANAINIVQDATLGAEAYGLEINADGIVITASSRAGFFYAFQTLKQLLPAEIFGNSPVGLSASENWTLPLLEINDAPLLGYRGFHLDVARHFFTVDEVKKLLDVAASYKLNRFHWHLTDDQGWRIEIPEYPKLTTVGAIRNRSLTVTGSPNFYDDTEYGRGCFYTLDQLKEVVDYAKARNIEILPEVDLPGHMVAAITAYPELSCDPTKKYEVRVDAGVSSDVLNVGDDKVIDFLKCVLGHVAEIFPYQYLHIGGDECPTTVWQTNADCARRIAEEGLSGVEELQPWLVETLGLWLKENYGKDVAVWDELLSHWNDRYTIKPLIMAWNSANYTVTAANKGFNSISVPYSPLYLDFMQVQQNQEIVDEPYIGGWGINPLPNVYNFNPLGNMSGKESFLLGTQANLWTESCTSAAEAEYQYFPRLLALSEIAWLPAAKKSWSGFYRRLQDNVKFLDERNVVYAKHYIEKPDLTPAQSVLEEADFLLSQSHPGAVGYPSEDAYEALSAAQKTLSDISDPSAEDVAALTDAISTYKSAAIKQPEAGKYYQIVSASTATRSRYAGSSLYAKDGGLRIHYTPQDEPEELWQFIAQGNGSYIISRVSTGQQIAMPTYDAALELSANGTPVMISVPTVATGSYTYLPGVVNITAAADVSSASAKRFFARPSGQVVANSEGRLCYPGTWRLVEITDYKAFLQSLVVKCERLIETGTTGGNGEPTKEALDFLSENVAVPGREALAGSVGEEVYLRFADLYEQFAAMPRVSPTDALDSRYFYRIRNAYFSSYYACLNTSSGIVEPKTIGDTDNYKWSFLKNEDGTVYIYNKASGKAASIARSQDGVYLRADREYKWKIAEVTTDQGTNGLGIIDGSGAYSWYVNPSSFSAVLMKPYTYGAGIWTFEKLDEEVSTGIGNMNADIKPAKYWDLSGRRVSDPERGIYVTDQRSKVVMK